MGHYLVFCCCTSNENSRSFLFQDIVWINKSALIVACSSRTSIIDSCTCLAIAVRICLRRRCASFYVKLSVHFLICCFIGVRRHCICHTFLAGTFDVSCPPIKSLLTKKPPKGGYNNGQELHLSHLQQGHCLLCYALLLPFSQIVRTRSIVFFSFVASCATSLFVSFSEWQYS